MDQVPGQNKGVNQNVAELLSSGMREAWKKFIEEFNQVFDKDQLDPVLSVLKQLKSNSQNPMKKQRSREEEEEKDESLSESDNDVSLTLEKKVFGNHLLAKSVFKYLPQSDLLSCRLINSYWDESATEILLKRDCAIQFSRRKNSIRYFQGDSEDRVSNWRTLDMLTELLRTAKKFPCNTFEFWGGNLGNDDAQRFFSVYGQFIKTIKIWLNDENLVQDKDKSEDGFSVSYTGSRVLGMILSHQLSNLQTLELDLSQEEGEDWPGLDSLLFTGEQQVVLPNLRTITYGCRQSDDSFILGQLLNAAVNLKQFHFANGLFNTEYLNLFIETGKMKTIADVDFDVAKLGQLERIVEHGPEVGWLVVSSLSSVCKEPRNWQRISTILSNLLVSSKESLENLWFTGTVGFLPQLQLPIVENLKNLLFKVKKQYEFNSHNVHAYSYSFLPRGTTFSRNFPQLNYVDFSFEVEISNDDNAAIWWSKCFPTDEIVPTVKKLIFRGPAICPELWMKKLSLMFPNVSSLYIFATKDFLSFSQTIWKNYQNITDLHVEIDISFPLNRRPFALDSSFTGIPLEPCKMLEKRSLSDLESVGVNFVEHPSILNLKALQTLDIGFNDLSEPGNESYGFSSILTRVTGVCAFKRMDNLNGVNIGVRNFQCSPDVQSRLQGFLQPLTAYKVTIN